MPVVAVQVAVFSAVCVCVSAKNKRSVAFDTSPPAAINKRTPNSQVRVLVCPLSGHPYNQGHSGWCQPVPDLGRL